MLITGSYSTEDLPEFRPNDRVTTYSDRIFQDLTKNIKPNNQVSIYKLSRIIFYPFRWQIFIYCVYQIAIYISFFVISIIIESLINEVILNKNSNTAYQYAGLLTAIVFINCILIHQGFLMIQETSSKMRLSIAACLYRKIISLNSYQIKQANIGTIIGLISNDLNNMQFNFFFLATLIVSPFAIAGSLTLLIYRHGPYGILFLLFLFIILPIQTIFS